MTPPALFAALVVGLAEAACEDSPTWAHGTKDCAWVAEDPFPLRCAVTAKVAIKAGCEKSCSGSGEDSPGFRFKFKKHVRPCSDLVNHKKTKKKKKKLCKKKKGFEAASTACAVTCGRCEEAPDPTPLPTSAPIVVTPTSVLTPTATPAPTQTPTSAPIAAPTPAPVPFPTPAPSLGAPTPKPTGAATQPPTPAPIAATTPAPAVPSAPTTTPAPAVPSAFPTSLPPTATPTPPPTPSETPPPTTSPTSRPGPTPGPAAEATGAPTAEAGWSEVGGGLAGEYKSRSGRSVSLSADGTSVAISEPDWLQNPVTLRGRALVYERVGTAWSQKGGALFADDGEDAYDYAGAYQEVRLSAAGDVVAVGASLTLHGEAVGRVRVFAWGGSAWDPRGEAIAGPTPSFAAVALSGDGRVVAIGAPDCDDLRGTVGLYGWGGGAWNQRGPFLPGKAFADMSGAAVALNFEGNVVAIGAPYHSPGDAMAWAGHVRVYEWGDGAWAQRGLDIYGEHYGDRSGSSVALSGDGFVVAIGAPHDDDPDAARALSGAARVFELAESGWVQRGEDIDGVAPKDEASTVSLSADGRVLALGAPFNDDGGEASGHARVFRWSKALSAWEQIGDPIVGEAAGDSVGWALSLSADGHVLAVGFPGNDGGSEFQGEDDGMTRVYSFASPASSRAPTPSPATTPAPTSASAAPTLGLLPWTQRGDDLDGEAAGDLSGLAVALNFDGTVVAIRAGKGCDIGQLQRLISRSFSTRFG